MTPNASKIDHLVVLMMENRSFDHMLGYLKTSGRPEIDGLTGAESNSYQGKSYRVHPLSGTVFRDDPDHSYKGTAIQIDQQMGGFVRDFAESYAAAQRPHLEELGGVMGYQPAANVRMYDLLAREFCVCDRYHASHPGPTWPNRLYALAGTSDKIVENPGLSPFPAFKLKTIFDHLGDHGVDFRYYEHDVAFLRIFEKYRYDVTHVVPVSDFYARAAAGTLAPVSFIDPDFIDLPPVSTASDDHPPADIGHGQALVKRIYDALSRGPKWGRTLFIVSYDEHGGFYDHVYPPPAHDNPGFRRHGVRVPSLVISPWVPRGSVSHELFDHTSILKTILLKHCRTNGIIDTMSPRVDAAKDLWPLLSEPAPRPAPPSPQLPPIAPSPVSGAAPRSDFAQAMIYLRAHSGARQP